MINVSDHAIKRYAEHHPGCFAIGLRHAIADATLIPREVALGLFGRRPSGTSSGDHYALAPDRRGVFVLVNGGGVVVRCVTYIRLSTPATVSALESYAVVEEAGMRRVEPIAPNFLPDVVPVERVQATVREVLVEPTLATPVPTTMADIKAERAKLVDLQTRLTARLARLNGAVKEVNRLKADCAQEAARARKAVKAQRQMKTRWSLG